MIQIIPAWISQIGCNDISIAYDQIYIILGQESAYLHLLRYIPVLIYDISISWGHGDIGQDRIKRRP